MLAFVASLYIVDSLKCCKWFILSFVEKQVLDSPFTKKEFLNLVKQFNNDQDSIFKDFAISDKTIVNIGNRDFVDYRPNSEISRKF